MIKSTEKTTKYVLKKKDVVDLLMKEANLDGYAPGMVKVEFECTGGYTPAYDHYDTESYTPHDLHSVTITVTEKS